jgi:hypothetical protein
MCIQKNVISMGFTPGQHQWILCQITAILYLCRCAPSYVCRVIVFNTDAGTVGVMKPTIIQGYYNCTAWNLSK